MPQDTQAALKQAAAERAVDFVQSGMVVGLGTGSTAIFATRRIGALLREGRLRDVTGFPTSQATEDEARRLGIPLLGEDLPRAIDLTIDGADEVDPSLNLIKGGGGALLREKIVAEASRREVIVVDESKLSPMLGTRWALPVEVIAFGWRSQARYLEALGCQPNVRSNGSGAPFRTDQGNLILDCVFGPIAQPQALAQRLAARGYCRARAVSRHHDRSDRGGEGWNSSRDAVCVIPTISRAREGRPPAPPLYRLEGAAPAAPERSGETSKGRETWCVSEGG
jgi:ribose 5-phosphate isomerase A